MIRSEGQVDVQAIGAQAVNQAIKAIAIARSYLEEDNLDLTIQPSFVKLVLQNDERTAIRLRVSVAEPLEEEPLEDAKEFEETEEFEVQEDDN